MAEQDLDGEVLKEKLTELQEQRQAFANRLQQTDSESAQLRRQLDANEGAQATIRELLDVVENGKPKKEAEAEASTEAEGE